MIVFFLLVMIKLLCVLFYSSLDLSELAKAAKKKLQAVSVSTWESDRSID